MDNRSLIARDASCVWHPCTQMKDHEQFPPIPIKRGEGVWLYDCDGRRYLDAISSWWVNLFGHANPRINAALRDQLKNVEHVIFAGFTHEPAVALAERLTRLAPAGLTRAMYADSGSSAVEIALKMSYHYFRNSGRGERTRFVSLAGSYHGETLGALAVGDVALYKETYEPLLMRNVVAPSPDAYLREPGETPAQFAERAAEAMHALLARHANEVCAVIVEPLVQCAGGMRMHDPAYLRRLRAICDAFVGMGRTGTMFACEQAAIRPDFLLLGKGLTGGYLPLSAVLTTDKIHAAFYDDFATRRAFLHSHSYAGNPLGCRAALATLDIFAAEPVLERNRRLGAYMETACAALTDHPHVADVRRTGMILAVEMVRDRNTRTPFDWRERRGHRVYRYGLEHEALLRPLGDVIYFMPPYVITEEEIDLLARVATAGIAHATVG